MSIRTRSVLLFLAGALLAGRAPAQPWGVGATYGWSNDVERQFRLDGFKPRDAQVWVDYLTTEEILLRGTFGSMRVRGDTAGQPATVGTSPIVVPEYEDRIDYVTLGASYIYREGGYTGGLFAGIGGYRIRADHISPELDAFRDPDERVFGWHAGVEGDLRLVSRFSIVGRMTFHRILSTGNRSLLVGSVGAVYRF